MAETKTFAYIRVSSKDQNLDRQIDSMKKYVQDNRDIYYDKLSGKNFERPGYQSLKFTLRSGDTLYIHSLDRLGRNKTDVKNELKELTDRGIIIRILDIPTSLMDYNQFGPMQKAIMDMVNNILIEVLATIAETERVRTRERQTEGIAAAKKRGKKFGRKAIEFPADWETNYNAWKAQKVTAVSIYTKYNFSSQTYYRLVKKWESQQGQ